MQQLKSARVSLKKPESIQITVYPPTLRKYDLTNKAESIMDALVDAKIIEDDNVNVVPKLILIHGGKDKDNPRAEIIIS
jgi:Holliday junction resolvase RusA-like endonuclease